MILTPIPPDRLRRALGQLAASLEGGSARRVLRRIAESGPARRAQGRCAAQDHRAALHLARRRGLGLAPGRPAAGVSWDGRAARTATDAYVLLHEIAHFQLAAPGRRRAIDFALGPGPETGDRARALRAARLDGVAREREEALTSLLGILWEAALGQPALASFLDQNWLEGAGRRGAAQHFERTVAVLRRGGFIDAAGRPTLRLRRAADAASAGSAPAQD